MTDSGYPHGGRDPRRPGPASGPSQGGPIPGSGRPGQPGRPATPYGAPGSSVPPYGQPPPGFGDGQDAPYPYPGSGGPGPQSVPPGRMPGRTPPPTVAFPSAGAAPLQAAPRGALPPGPPPPPGGPPPPSGKTPRRTPGWLLATRIVALVAAVAVLVAVGIGWLLTGTLQANSGTSDAASNAGTGGVTFQGGMTILLVGSDARTDADGNPLTEEELKQVATEDDGGGLNTDTMMLVHIPEGGGRATAVSIPRDTWIGPRVTEEITGPYPSGGQGEYDPNKINSFYATAKAYTEEALVSQGVTDAAERERLSNEAGRTMLVRVIQAFTGMKIDHYAEVNLLGFYLLSNAIGGVPVCLNAAVDDPWSGANFPAGEQEVQGTAALSFVRQRHGLPNGDLDRVKRQQAFLAGAVDKILSVGTLTNPSRLSELVNAVDRSVVFDKDFSVLTFAEQMANLSSGNMTFETVPTTGPEQSTDKDALATDPAQIRAFFQAITNSSSGANGGTAPSTVDPASVTVDVQDGTVADGVTTFAAQIVEDGGFALGSLGVVPGTDSGSETAVTEIHFGADGAAAAEKVREAFGLGQLIEDDAIAAGHVLVIIGTDLEVPGNGLRGASSAFSSAPAVAAAAAPAAAAPAPAAAVSASAVPCIN